MARRDDNDRDDDRDEPRERVRARRDDDAPPREVKRDDLDRDPGFEARDGDTLVVHYGGIKLSPRQYQTVELDSVIYSRTLRAGDDVREQFSKIYAWAESNVLGRGRAKLKAVLDELDRARGRGRD